MFLVQVNNHAGDLISEVTVLMNGNMSLIQLASVIHPYPTQADAIRKIGDMYNKTRLTTKVKIMMRKFLDARR